MFRLFGRLLAVVVVGWVAPAHAALVTLYDGNGLPADQPWLVYADDSLLGGSVTQTAVAGGVQLTSDALVRAGVSNYVPLLNTLKNGAFPGLERANGFELSFTAQLQSESHQSNDRAGFSVILLGSDGLGIELGFWQNEIWAQTSAPLFTHGTGTLIDTTIQRDYRLRIEGNDYTLFGDANQILTGSLQDYTAFGSAPYTLQNYLFLGDNTTSAAADVILGPIALESNLAAIPEPSSALLLLASLPLLAAGRRARGCRRQPSGAPEHS